MHPRKTNCLGENKKKNKEPLKYKEMYFRIRSMDTFKNKMVQYGIDTNAEVRYFNSTVNGTLLYFVLLPYIQAKPVAERYIYREESPQGNCN